MSKKDWSALTSVFGKTGTNAQAKNIQKEPTYFDTNFKTFEKSFYGGYEVEAEEPVIPNEEFKKELKSLIQTKAVLTKAAIRQRKSPFQLSPKNRQQQSNPTNQKKKLL